MAILIENEQNERRFICFLLALDVDQSPSLVAENVVLAHEDACILRTTYCIALNTEYTYSEVLFQALLCTPCTYIHVRTDRANLEFGSRTFEFTVSDSRTTRRVNVKISNRYYK